MKRYFVLLGTLTFCAMLTGCSGDPREDAVGNIVSLMTAASGDVDSISKAVQAAIDKHQKDQSPFDLTEAVKATKSLKETGEKTQKIKTEKIDHVKAAEPDEREALAKEFKNKIVNAYTELKTKKLALNDVLLKAESIDADKVQELRSKIREAEAPFETIARQQS